MSESLLLQIGIVGYQPERVNEVRSALAAWLAAENLSSDFRLVLSGNHPTHGAVLQTRSPYPVNISGAYRWLPEARASLQATIAAANGANCPVTLEGLRPSETQGRTALNPGEVLRIELRDVPNNFVGGTNLTINADGSCWLQKVMRGGFAQKQTLQLASDTLPYLVATINEVDFFSVPEPTRPGVPDESRPEIHLYLASGQTIIRWKWANDKQLPFNSVYKRLLEVAN
jgi:hypothetical protein